MLPEVDDQRSEDQKIRLLTSDLAMWRGAVSAAIRGRIAKLTPAEAERMMRFLAQCQSLDEVTQWLAGARTKGRGELGGELGEKSN
jgi:hypothetical protein